ncbi:MAG: hypothetical protein JW955_02685 [Sedimentisphaerales bacterium]|nr:hypothetical protein [Sedimentisphaerales bacterium]
MWEATHAAQWRGRAQRAAELLIRIQQLDGGFDIGYEFDFGRLHRKGQSTSPELVGLVALCEYARLFGGGDVQSAAVRAAEWIRMHALDMGEDKAAIPYSPHTVKEVMIYNGTSFAAGALGCYLGQFGGDEGLRRIYNRMIRYMESVLTVASDLPGRFWHYWDQSRDDLDSLKRTKIDYYHQMQQVEMHALAEQACPAEGQARIIRDGAGHVVALSERRTIIPYTNDPNLFRGQIHLWGLASVIPGMLEAGVVIPECSTAYRGVARHTLMWVLEHAWNGEYFEAVLERDGAHVQPGGYMVRSDAWVFNALAAAVKYLRDDPWTDIAERCYRKMESVDFSGPESHASRKTARVLLHAYGLLSSVGKAYDRH